MLTIDKNTTRIDFEKAGNDVLVKYWYGKWAEGSAAAVTSYLVNTGIASLLMECEKAGFTCEMATSEQGRALRGEITRIDFVKVLNAWHIKKYPRGWTARTRPLSDTIKTEAEIQAAVQWCESNGWNVRKNADGTAIAFKGAVKPIHDAATIRRMRSYAQRDRRDYFTDFAYKP